MTDQRPLYKWRAAIVSSDLPATCRHVALTLSLHMNEEGDSCFPSVDTTAAETGLSRRAVQLNITRLVDGQWLKLHRGGGRGRSNRYVAVLPPASVAPVVAPSGAPPIDSETVHQKHRISNTVSETVFEERERVHLTTRKGAPGAPEVFKRTPEDSNAQATLIDLPAAPEPAPDPKASKELATERFEKHLWPIWPRREGKRVGKAKALTQWLKLTIDQQRDAVKGARAYAAYCERAKRFPKDAERWLRDHEWTEWLTDDGPDQAPKGIGPAAGLKNGGSLSVVPSTPEEWAAMGFPGVAAS